LAALMFSDGKKREMYFFQRILLLLSHFYGAMPYGHIKKMAG
jgi:hypothetical protein